jgi:chromosome segregation ATPase
MINKHNSSAAAVAVMLVLGAVPALAQTTTRPLMRRAPSSTVIAQRMTQMTTRADQEITQRVSALNALMTRIENMKNVSSAEKSTLQTTIQNEVTALTSLEQKIAGDTSTTTLRADLGSITQSYRIYALVLPQGEILATADRALTIAASMTTLGTDLESRVSQAQSAGKAVTTVQSALSDLTAKVTDAQTNAQATITEVSGLVPDQGNQATLQANTAALKDARAKIKTANQDLVTARKDAGTIVKGLKSLETAPANAASSFGL